MQRCKEKDFFYLILPIQKDYSHIFTSESSELKDTKRDVIPIDNNLCVGIVLDYLKSFLKHWIKEDLCIVSVNKTDESTKLKVPRILMSAKTYDKELYLSDTNTYSVGDSHKKPIWVYGEGITQAFLTASNVADHICNQEWSFKSNLDSTPYEEKPVSDNYSLVGEDINNIGINYKYYPSKGSIKVPGAESRTATTEYWYSKVNNLINQVIEKFSEDFKTDFKKSFKPKQV